MLNRQIGRACQAVGLDEERKSFKPVLWRQQPGDEARIEQVWFPGVHSNVGGGYPRQGISLVTLDWMMRKAEEHDLRFLEPQRSMYRDTTDVDDKLYDSRAGFGVVYRLQPRNPERLCRINNIPPKVHRTAFQRIARNTEGYAPGSVPPDSEVVTSSSPSIAEPVRELVASYHAGRGPLLERERPARILGWAAYWMMMTTIIAFVFMMFSTMSNDLPSSVDWRAHALSLVKAVSISNWFGIVARTAWHYPWILAAACVAFLVTLRVDRHLDERYSEFWHGLRAPLRKLLERRDR
jgi:hypothetical protein